MSRIGRLPIAVPAGVTVDIAENNKVTVKGPKGTLERVLPAEMKIEKDGDEKISIISWIFSSCRNGRSGRIGSNCGWSEHDYR